MFISCEPNQQYFRVNFAEMLGVIIYLLSFGTIKLNKSSSPLTSKSTQYTAKKKKSTQYLGIIRKEAVAVSNKQ